MLSSATDVRGSKDATLPSQFDGAGKYGAAEQDDGRGPCDDLRIHGRPPSPVEHLHGLRLIAGAFEEALSCSRAWSWLATARAPSRLCARDCAAMTAVRSASWLV